METIKNDKLTLTISGHGAELLSIKDNGERSICGKATLPIGDGVRLFFFLSWAQCGTTLTA